MTILSIYLFGGETSLLGNLNYTGHEKEAVDIKLGGHFILETG